jgi:hypothetical protein
VRWNPKVFSCFRSKGTTGATELFSDYVIRAKANTFEGDAVDFYGRSVHGNNFAGYNVRPTDTVPSARESVT